MESGGQGAYVIYIQIWEPLLLYLSPTVSSENPSFGLKHAHFTLAKVKMKEEHI